MYFVIGGKHSELTRQELMRVKPQMLKTHAQNMFTFETEFPQRLQDLGSIVKWGRVVESEQLPQFLHGQTIAGVEDTGTGIFIKKKYGIRRFKVCKRLHTDREIANKGIELFVFSGKVGHDPQWAIVQGYQPISVYEAIDFEKPARDMHMGMMPAKLTHIMMTIGLSKSKDTKDICIYDPFAGSGTTNMLANYLGYDTLATDLENKHLEPNFTRRKTQELYDNTHNIEQHKHDICTPLQQTLGDNFKKKNILIVTEGWLGPIVGRQTTTEDIQSYQDQVYAVYVAFIHTIKSYFDTMPTIVCSIPWYMQGNNTILSRLQKDIQKQGLQLQEIHEVYHRENQYVGRKIVIIS